MKLRIPTYAKKAAKKGLLMRKKLPKSQKFGITKEEAEKLGIVSGVERAKQLIRNKYINDPDIISMVKFYLRFRNQKGKRAEGSLLLWGGRRFLRELIPTFRSMKRN